MDLNKLRILIWALFLLLPSFLILNSSAYSDNGGLSPLLELEFGMSGKNAKKLIVGNNREILKDEVDSKEIRTISFNGAINEYPYISDINKAAQRTKLEFYNDKLMSTSFVIKKLQIGQFTEVLNEFLKSIKADFGDFISKDTVGSYDVWTWRQQDLKIVLSTNRNKREIKLKSTYTPLADYKAEEELNVKRRGEIRHPADQMFKDGNYSQQSGPMKGRNSSTP